MKRLHGLTVALLTPFTKKGDIDQNFLKDHLDMLIDTGVKNILILGTTAEVMMLDKSERKKLTEKVIELVDGRVDVFVQVGLLPTEAACELAGHAEVSGASGIAVLSPYYYDFSQEEIIHYYREVSAAVSDNFSVYLYNIPQCTTVDVLPETVAELSKETNIIGIKNSMNDLDRIMNLVSLTPADFDVLLGEDKIVLPALMYGAKGFVSGTANAFPEVFLNLYDNFNNEKFNQAQRNQDLAIDIVKKLEVIPSFALFKKALNIRGLKEVFPRDPFRRLESEEIEVINKLMDRYFNEMSLS